MHWLAILNHATILSFLATEENPQMTQIFADLFCLSFKNPRLYRERHENVVFGLPQFCQPQRAQRFHKEHKDTQAQGFVSFVHPLYY